MTLFHHPEHEHKARNINVLHTEQLTTGARIADAVASGMGSWVFIIGQAALLTFWFILIRSRLLVFCISILILLFSAICL